MRKVKNLLFDENWTFKIVWQSKRRANRQQTKSLVESSFSSKATKALRNGESNKKRVDIFCDHHRSKSSSARVAGRRQTCHDLNQRETLQNTTLKGKIIGFLDSHNVLKSLEMSHYSKKETFKIFFFICPLSRISLPQGIVVPFPSFILCIAVLLSSFLSRTLSSEIGWTINPKSLSGCVCFLSLLLLAEEEVLTAHLLGGRESD